MHIHFSHDRQHRKMLAAGLVLALTACGGGGGGGGSPGDGATGGGTATVGGTAAVGSAITGAAIVARCSDGSGFTSAVTTSASGTFSGQVARDALPCALKLSDGKIDGGAEDAPTLYSMADAAASGDIVAHITPLTHLALARAVAEAADENSGDKSIDSWFDSLGNAAAPAARIAAAAVVDNPNGLCVLRDTFTVTGVGPQTTTVCQYQVPESWCDDNDGMVTPSPTPTLTSDTTRTAEWTPTCPSNADRTQGNPLGGPGNGTGPSTGTGTGTGTGTNPGTQQPHPAQALLNQVKAELNAAIAALSTSLAGYTTPGSFNPFNTPLQAGQASNAYDKLLDAVRDAVLSMIGSWAAWLDYANAYGASSPNAPVPAPAQTPSAPTTPVEPTAGAKTWNFTKDSSPSTFLGVIAGEHDVVITSGPVTGKAKLTVSHGSGRVTMTLTRGTDMLFSGNPLLDGTGEKHCAGSSRLACGLVLRWLDPSDMRPFAPAGTPGKDVNIWHYYNEGSAGQTGMQTVWLPNGVIRGVLSSNYAPTYTFSNYETADETEVPAEQEGPAEVRALTGSYSGKVTSQNASLGFPTRGADITVTVSDKGTVTVGSQVFTAGGYKLSKLNQSYLPEPRYELTTGSKFTDRKLVIFLDLETGKPRVFQVSEGSPSADIAIPADNNTAMQQFMTDLVGKGKVTLYKKDTCENMDVTFSTGQFGEPLTFAGPGATYTYNDRSARFTASDESGQRKLVMFYGTVFLTAANQVRIGPHSNNSVNIYEYWSEVPAERNCP